MGSFGESLGITAGSGGGGGGVVGRGGWWSRRCRLPGEELCCRGPGGGTPTGSAATTWVQVSEGPVGPPQPPETGSILLETQILAWPRPARPEGAAENKRLPPRHAGKRSGSVGGEGVPGAPRGRHRLPGQVTCPPGPRLPGAVWRWGGLGTWALASGSCRGSAELLGPALSPRAWRPLWWPRLSCGSRREGQVATATWTPDLESRSRWGREPAGPAGAEGPWRTGSVREELKCQPELGNNSLSFPRSPGGHGAADGL